MESLASHSCAEIALSQTAGGRATLSKRAAWALQPSVHNCECVSVVWDCQFNPGTLGEKNPEPMASPAVSFHVQQENFAVSAGVASKHPPASLDASACWIFCVGFTTCHVSSWLPSIVPGCASASQQGSVA